MYGNEIAKQMESFWSEHGGRHDHPEWIAFLSDYRSLIGRKLDEQAEEHDNKGRFGMSKAGGCTRSAVLKALGAKDSPLTGSTRATFFIGHELEIMAIATLGACGYSVVASTEDGEQISASIDPFMHSYSDGRLWLDRETLLSVKSMGYKMSGKDWKSGTWKRYGFAQYPLDGVKKANPGYWAQMQAEMHGTGVAQSLFVIVAKDMIKAMEGDPVLKQNGSLTFYTELVPYDPVFCATQLLPTWQEAWDARQAGEPGRAMVLHGSGVYVELDPAGDAKANKAITGTFDYCSYCSLVDECRSAKLTAQLSASLEAAS